MSWDPAQYLKFSGERLRPAVDLLSHVPLTAPGHVFDLGCGAGNVTRLMAQRWPDARITGVDSSADMLSRAPEGAITWIHEDLNHWSPATPADLFFSNAAFNWLDDHEALFPRLMAGLKPGGMLAVQMPRNHAAPSHTCMADAAVAGPWKKEVFPLLRPSPVHAPSFYDALLWPLAESVDIWETEYRHVLDGDDPIAEWTRGTALRPLLAAAGDSADEFYAAYAERLRAAYPKRADGKTVFPFKRLFIVARRAA